MKMKDVNMCQQLHIPHLNEIHTETSAHAAVCVNEQSIELSRDYKAKAEAITDALISRIKLEFISH